MKILDVSNLGYLNGGAEIEILLKKEALERLGHTVKILTSDAAPELPHFGDYEFPSLDRQPFLLRMLFRAFYPASASLLKKVLAEYRPDVIHFHTLSGVSPSVLFLCKGYKVVVTVHQTEDYTTSILPWSFPAEYFKDGSHKKEELTVEGKLRYWYHRYLIGGVFRIGFRSVGAFIAVSTYMQERLREDDIESIRIANAIKPLPYEPINQEGQDLLFAGRLEETKGAQDAIAALALVRENYPDAKLRIAGRGPHEGELRSLVERLSLGSHVTFLDHLSREQLVEEYKRATVVIMPSIWPESFGLVGVEAESAGRPVVASNIGGVSDWLVDGENGFAVPPESPKDIAEKVQLLLGNRELLARMSKKARESSLRFDVGPHIEKILAVYEKPPASARREGE